MVGEYVDGTMYSSTTGGHSFNDFIGPPASPVIAWAAA